MVENNVPSYADIRLFTGEQGSGKSNTLVAFPVGDYYSQMTALITPSGARIKAHSLTKEDKLILQQSKIFANKLQYCRVFSDDGKQSKLIRIPKDYLVESPVHIFANFHLYGIRYSPISITDIIENLNEPTFDEGWILSDESVMTDARNSMEAFGKLSATFGGMIRKRAAHLCVAAQYNEMVERRLRLFATTRITCSYDETTGYITLTIKKRGEPEFSTDYWAKTYWRFFDTKELIKVPPQKIRRALTNFNKVWA